MDRECSQSSSGGPAPTETASEPGTVTCGESSTPEQAENLTAAIQNLPNGATVTPNLCSVVFNLSEGTDLTDQMAAQLDEVVLRIRRAEELTVWEAENVGKVVMALDSGVITEDCQAANVGKVAITLDPDVTIGQATIAGKVAIEIDPSVSVEIHIIVKYFLGRRPNKINLKMC